MACRPFACRVALLTTAIVAAAPVGALAQTFVCWPVAPGETAPMLARRLTGDAMAAYRDIFQIRDPAHRTFVPKSQYGRLRAGWHVCVVREALPPAAPGLSSPPLFTSSVVAAPPPAIAALPRRMAPSDFAAALCVGIATALFLLAGTLALQRATASPAPPELQRVGEQFVSAFARPLLDPGASTPPIVMRLHFIRRSEELEIHLAPAGGRRYPNLLDHKRNVEYDIRRVLQLLGPHVVVSNPVRAQDKWVVIPIRLVGRKQAGVQ